MQVVGVVAVGVDGVGGDQDIGQVQLVEQRGERGDLAALGLDLDLAEDAPLAWSSTDTRCGCR